MNAAAEHSAGAAWIVFDDSEVASLTWREGAWHVVFSAAHVQRDEAGALVDGYQRGVELTLETRETPRSIPSGCFGRLSQGRLLADGRWLSRWPLPGVSNGPVRVEFSFANRSEWSADADRCALVQAGSGPFQESMAC